MQVWTLSEKIALVSLAVAVVAGFASVMAVGRPLWRRLLAGVLLLVTAASVYLLRAGQPPERKHAGLAAATVSGEQTRTAPRVAAAAQLQPSPAPTPAAEIKEPPAGDPAEPVRPAAPAPAPPAQTPAPPPPTPPLDERQLLQRDLVGKWTCPINSDLEFTKEGVVVLNYLPDYRYEVADGKAITVTSPLGVQNSWGVDIRGETMFLTDLGVTYTYTRVK